MKCLVLAAGRGSRLKTGTGKPLISLLGLPLIERTIRSSIAAGIDDFCVVSGYRGDQLRRFLDGVAERCHVSITHVINEEWEQGNGLSVLKAKECLNDPFLLLMTDHLFDPDILRDLAGQTVGPGEMTLAVDYEIANPLVDLDDVTRVKCENGKVHDIGKGLTSFDGFDTGIFFCPPALFHALEWAIKKQGDSSLSAGVRHLAAQGKVNALDIRGRFWLDVDDPPALAKGEKALIEQYGEKRNDGPVSRYINRPLSIRLSRHLSRFPVTPNQISFISFVGSLLAAGLFTVGTYPSLLIGGILAQVASIIDGCDGEIARLKFMKTDYGGWFDAVLDRYADAFLLLGLTGYVYGHGSNPLDLWVGFLAIIGSFMVSYTADKYDSLMRSRITGRAELRVGRDLRVFLIFLGAALNQPSFILLLMAVFMNGEVIRRV